MSRNTLVIFYPNPVCAEVQTKSVLLDKKYHFNDTPDDAPANLLSMEASMRKIPGVKSCNIGRHDIHLERFEVFEWSEIIDHVIAALERALSMKLTVETDDRRGKQDHPVGHYVE